MKEQLLRQHRAIEVCLDELIAAIQSRGEYYEIVTRIEDLLIEHFSEEQPFLEKLKRRAPKLAAKVHSQHHELFEISGHMSDAMAGYQMDSALRLARRFHALAQHNIIEEERDVFPVAARCFEF